MITEELSHLKGTVDRFGEFARLPQVQTAELDLNELLGQHIAALATTFEAADLRFEASPQALRARVDPILFRQVLANIVRNGIEANPGRRTAFLIQLTRDASGIRLALTNDGAPVAAEISSRIFDPYISTRGNKDNMGLGLAIAKKIVIEHGGDIVYMEIDGHPSFVISLPGYRHD